MTTYLLKADLPPNTRLMDLVLTGGAGGKVTVIPIEAAYPADDPTALRGLEAEPPLRSIADEPLYRRVDMLETEIKHLADMEQRADADMSRRIAILENLLDKAFAMLAARATEEEGFDILGRIRKLESRLAETDLAKAMNETLYGDSIKVGDRVRKKGGGYAIEGVVLATYSLPVIPTPPDNGARAVVNIEPQGFQHIYRFDQLEVI